MHTEIERLTAAQAAYKQTGVIKMSNLKLEKTTTDYTYFRSELCGGGSRCVGEYVFHNVDAFYQLVINGKSFDVDYQNGHSFYGDDYTCPQEELEYFEGSELAYILNELSESDFDDDELINEKLKDVQNECADIKNVEELFQLYVFFRDNTPDIEDAISGFELNKIESVLEDNDRDLVKYDADTRFYIDCSGEEVCPSELEEAA